MTISEKDAADKAKTSNVKVLGKFSKAFRSNELNNLMDGESFIVPENFTVFSRTIRGSENPAEYINVKTNTGRVIEFYPGSIVRNAWKVDENGKNVMQDGRQVIVRSDGNLVPFVQGKEIDSTMRALAGCEISYKIREKVPTRTFGVDEAVATSKDVQTVNIGTWNIIGDKKPEGWVD